MSALKPDDWSVFWGIQLSSAMTTLLNTRSIAINWEVESRYKFTAEFRTFSKVIQHPGCVRPISDRLMSWPLICGRVAHWTLTANFFRTFDDIKRRVCLIPPASASPCISETVLKNLLINVSTSFAPSWIAIAFIGRLISRILVFSAVQSSGVLHCCCAAITEL